jgi:hypothetical protein
MLTGCLRISCPINRPNSSGDISPSPLNLVISGLRQFFHGRLFSRFIVAVDRFLFIPHAEQRRFQNVHMPRFTRSGKNCRKKGHQQQPDVHAIHIGIGCDDDIVVPQSFQPIFNIQRMLQQVEFFVLVHHFFGEAE